MFDSKPCDTLSTAAFYVKIKGKIVFCQKNTAKNISEFNKIIPEMNYEKKVQKICELGLTTKQARVYASILCKAHTIAEISEKTSLHESDIYKMISRLEEMGLVTKILYKPIKVEAIDIKKALSNLIILQEKNLVAQKAIVQEIIESQNVNLESDEGYIRNRFCIFPPKTQAYKNQVELAYKNTKESFDAFVPEEQKGFDLTEFDDTFTYFSKKVKIRVLIAAKRKRSERLDKWPTTATSLKRLSNLNLTVKETYEKTNFSYVIFDRSYLWIPLVELDGRSTLLFTDSKTVLGIVQNHFDKFWQDKKTIAVLDTNVRQMKNSEPGN